MNLIIAPHGWVGSFEGKESHCVSSPRGTCASVMATRGGRGRMSHTAVCGQELRSGVARDPAEISPMGHS